MMPYCRERSIDFLYDYVRSWIWLVDIFLKDPTLLKDSDTDNLKRIILSMTELHQAWRNIR